MQPNSIPHPGLKQRGWCTARAPSPYARACRAPSAACLVCFAADNSRSGARGGFQTIFQKNSGINLILGNVHSVSIPDSIILISQVLHITPATAVCASQARRLCGPVAAIITLCPEITGGEVRQVDRPLHQITHDTEAEAHIPNVACLR